jgi:hypothetical protein
MIRLTPSAHSSKYYDARRYIIGHPGIITKYNYVVDMINYSQKNLSEPKPMRFMPEVFTIIYSMTYNQQALIAMVLMFGSFIPAVNLLTVLVLIILFGINLYKSCILNSNAQCVKNPFESFLEYNDLCVDSNNEELPSQIYDLDFSQFSAEDYEIVVNLKLSLGLDLDSSVYSFIVYRKQLEDWFKAPRENIHKEFLLYSICLFNSILFTPLIDYLVLIK